MSVSFMPLNWDEYFLAIADVVAAKATCPVANVGSVFIDPETHSILSVGYNGAPRKTKHCDKCNGRKMAENSNLCRAVHAEVNAIYNAALNGVSLKGSVVYSTHSPCVRCAQAIVQVGVKRVVYVQEFPTKDFIPLFVESKIIWNRKRV